MFPSSSPWPWVREPHNCFCCLTLGSLGIAWLFPFATLDPLSLLPQVVLGSRMLTRGIALTAFSCPLTLDWFWLKGSDGRILEGGKRAKTGYLLLSLPPWQVTMVVCVPLPKPQPGIGSLVSTASLSGFCSFEYRGVTTLALVYSNIPHWFSFLFF